MTFPEQVELLIWEGREVLKLIDRKREPSKWFQVMHYLISMSGVLDMLEEQEKSFLF